MSSLFDDLREGLEETIAYEKVDVKNVVDIHLEEAVSQKEIKNMMN